MIATNKEKTINEKGKYSLAPPTIKIISQTKAFAQLSIFVMLAPLLVGIILWFASKISEFILFENIHTLDQFILEAYIMIISYAFGAILYLIYLLIMKKFSETIMVMLGYGNRVKIFFKYTPKYENYSNYNFEIFLKPIVAYIRKGGEIPKEHNFLSWISSESGIPDTELEKLLINVWLSKQKKIGITKFLLLLGKIDKFLLVIYNEFLRLKRIKPIKTINNIFSFKNPFEKKSWKKTKRITFRIMMSGFSVLAIGWLALSCFDIPESAFFKKYEQIIMLPIFLPFLIAIISVIFYTTIEWLEGRIKKIRKTLIKTPELFHDERVITFYENTIAVWSSGKLSHLNNKFEIEGEKTYDEFVKTYRPYYGSGLFVLFTSFPPREDEFLVEVDLTSYNGWFVLTNKRLIQRDGLDNLFREVLLRQIDTFEMKGFWTRSIMFRMTSGQTIKFEKIGSYPSEESLSELIKQSRGSPNPRFT